jgi:hypothetical protein
MLNYIYERASSMYKLLIGVSCSWKEVKHDNTVTWLAFWNDPINQKDCKYVFLAASSSLKGQSDKEKYEKARKLKVRKFDLGSMQFFVFPCTLTVFLSPMAGSHTQYTCELHQGFQEQRSDEKANCSGNIPYR